MELHGQQHDEAHLGLADMQTDRRSQTAEELPPTSRFDQTAWRVSNRITHQLAIWGGRVIPLLVVAEHPRSGGTWLAHLLSDYLQIPFPKYLRRPTHFEAVVHSHLSYSPRLRRAVFVKRDGRDIVVSTFFKVRKGLTRSHADGSANTKLLRRYPSLAGATGELEDTRERLPHFIAEWWQRPLGCRINWEDYSMPWVNNRGNVVVTSYEAMRHDCGAELRKVLSKLSTRPIDECRLADTIARHTFEAQTGRRPGEADSQSNKRKGIVGDWKNYFTAEAAVTFHRLGGHALIALNYERDDSWVYGCGRTE